MTIEFAPVADDRVVTVQRTVRRLVESSPRFYGQPRPRFYARTGKRVLDVTVASAVLAVVIVPMCLIAFVLRRTLGPDVIYRQARIGLDGKVITVLKFRTMQADRRAAAVGYVSDGIIDRRLQHKTEADPRHTGIGRFLRKTSLDELPQLFNVLRGDMSVIGPRPELVHLVARMTEEQKRRHGVRPGLTGAWQVSARGTLALHEATDMDLDYIRHLSLKNDLLILMRTPAALFCRTGT